MTSAARGQSENWRSIGRAWNDVLAENPQSLKVVLDALLDALRREIVIEAEPVLRRESEPEEELCGVSTEPEF